MGKVTDLLKKVRSQKTPELVGRFKHIIGAQAIRSYIAAKPDQFLDIEVRITEEELLKRLIPTSPSYATGYWPGIMEPTPSQEIETQVD